MGRHYITIEQVYSIDQHGFVHWVCFTWFVYQIEAAPLTFFLVTCSSRVQQGCHIAIVPMELIVQKHGAKSRPRCAPKISSDKPAMHACSLRLIFHRGRDAHGLQRAFHGLDQVVEIGREQSPDASNPKAFGLGQFPGVNHTPFL